MSRFDPVELPEGRTLNGRVSQTMLRHYSQCPRSGYLYAKYKGEAQTKEMVRGSAIHKAIELALAEIVSREADHIPPEVVKAIADDVLGEFPVPLEEHDYIRESVYRWAETFTVDPASVLCIETLMVLELGGYTIRGKVDYAALVDGGSAVAVKDWKSSRAAPAYEEISRVRPDESRAAKNFQLIIYALMLAFGRPVREEYGRDGRVEVIEEFGLLPNTVQRFDLAFVYPGLKAKDGGMVSRDVSLTHLELLEYRESVERIVQRLGESERTGDWPAIVSDAACSECPASVECPIPAALRDYRGTINTVEQAAEAAERWDRIDADGKAIRREIKAFSKANGSLPIRFGANKVYDWSYSESDRIGDKDAMFDAIDRAVEYGEPFDANRFVKRSGTTRFSARTITVEELAVEEEQRNDG